MTSAAPTYSVDAEAAQQPHRRREHEGEDDAIVTGSSSGRACSSRSTTATKSRPRPSHGTAEDAGDEGLRGGLKVRPMMARPSADERCPEAARPPSRGRS
jgi:hypothetical protein